MADFTVLKTAIQNAIKQNGNEEITGNLLQDVLLAIVTTLGEGNINNLINSLDAEVTARQQAVSAEAQARQLADSTLQGGINTVSAAITAINNAIGNGCVYAGIATPSSTPASGKVFYLALTAGTYTNYGGLEVPQGINILKNNGSTWLLDSFLSIDDAPTQGSSNLVKSGGVLDSIIKDGSAFDLSAYNNGTTYANLDAALTALNALPAAYKKGGMSMKFVLSSDNKYVQARLMANAFTTDITKWQVVDDVPTAGSDNLVKSGGTLLFCGFCNLRNGSDGNVGNTVAVCTTYMPLYGKKISVHTNRPNSQNCEYRFGYALTSSTEDLYETTKWSDIHGQVYHYSYNSDNSDTVFDISGYPTAIGVQFAIAEWNTVNNTWNALRISDFSGYEVKILSSDAITDPAVAAVAPLANLIDDYNKNTIINIASLPKFEIVNGSQGNSGNAYVVTLKGVNSAPIPVTAGHRYKVFCNRPTSEGYDYYWLFCTYSSLSSQSMTENRVRREDINGATATHKLFEDVLIEDGEVGLTIQLTEAIGAGVTQSATNNKVLRYNSFDEYIICVADVTYATNVSENIITNSEKDAFRAKNGQKLAEYISFPCAIRNGSGGNPSNADSVTTEVVNSFGTSFIGIETNRPADANCSYRFCYCLTSSLEDIHSLAKDSELSGFVYHTNYNEAVKDNVFDISEYSSQTKGIRFSIFEHNDATNTLRSLRTTDFDGYYIKIITSGCIEQIIDKKIGSVHTDINTDVLNRNVDKRAMLSNACRINKDANGSKDFQMLIITDTHIEYLAAKNAVLMTNGFDTIDCMIHCGDITGTTYSPSQIEYCINDLKKSEKPWFVVAGNHDVGNTMKVYYGATHKEVYESLVKPMVDNGVLSNGEYTVNVPYYYHDFASRKIRLIVVYEYQAPLDIADNEYWEEVTYDSTKPKMTMDTTYTYDSGNPIILNCGGYTGGSFRLKKTVTTVAGQYVEGDTTPNYKVARADRVIMQDQAQWFINTLLSTPADYGIVVATHNPSMINSTNQPSKKFAVSGNIQASSVGQYSMVTDLLSDIVNAYINKTTLSLKVIMGASGWHGSSATYLNTLSADGVDYCYELTADFSGRNNSYFAGYVAGHAHRDLVFKHNTYSGQYCIAPICGITDSLNNANGDVARPRTDGQSYDAVTVFSAKKNRIALVRLGNDRTINGGLRDFEVIDTTE